MPFENLRFETGDGVATLTLARPDAANAIDLPLGIELMQAAIRCDEDPGVRAVVIRGAGRFFCAGGDVSSFARSGDSMPALLKELTVYLHSAISRFARMSAPVITAVHGPAAGAGFSLACAGDLTIASESARFTMAYTRVGLAPDGSSTYWVPRLVGPRRALELMLTNRTLSAAEALEWGLVNRVVSDDALDGEVNDLARALASGPTAAFGLTKRLVLHGATESLESQMELEARAISDAARTADAREGIAAFLARRDPSFSGA